MGSDLYDVRVRARDGTRVELEVRVVHPDAMHLPDDLGFALTLLREGASDDDPLAREVSFEDTMDEGWLRRWARGFLRSVEVGAVTEAPPPMRARYTIEATHPAWVGHLAPGASFASRAFEAASTYDPCEPIAPAGGEGRLLPDGPAFLAVPRELLVRWRMPRGVPAVLWHAAYAESAYRELERVPAARLDDATLSGWLGAPVRYQDRYGRTDDGGLAHAGEVLTLVSFGPGSMGCARLARTDVRWMGRLGFREHARTGERLTLGDLARRTPPAGIVSRRAGATLELAIRCYGERHVPRVETASQALAVLAAPLVEPPDRTPGDAPLARALAREKAAGGRPFLGEVYARIARGYVKRFELRPPARRAWPDVDAIPDAAERFDALGWPEWELTVEVHDPAWIAHFPAPPFALEGGHVPDPMPWDGPPARP